MKSPSPWRGINLLLVEGAQNTRNNLTTQNPHWWRFYCTEVTRLEGDPGALDIVSDSDWDVRNCVFLIHPFLRVSGQESQWEEAQETEIDHF